MKSYDKTEKTRVKRCVIIFTLPMTRLLNLLTVGLHSCKTKMGCTGVPFFSGDDIRHISKYLQEELKRKQANNN